MSLPDKYHYLVEVRAGEAEFKILRNVHTMDEGALGVFECEDLVSKEDRVFPVRDVRDVERICDKYSGTFYSTPFYFNQFREDHEETARFLEELLDVPDPTGGMEMDIDLDPVADTSDLLFHPNG